MRCLRTPMFSSPTGCGGIQVQSVRSQTGSDIWGMSSGLADTGTPLMQRVSMKSRMDFELWDHMPVSGLRKMQWARALNAVVVCARLPGTTRTEPRLKLSFKRKGRIVLIDPPLVKAVVLCLIFEAFHSFLLTAKSRDQGADTSHIQEIPDLRCSIYHFETALVANQMGITTH
jgi:hypothetical protein